MTYRDQEQLPQDPYWERGRETLCRWYRWQQQSMVNRAGNDGWAATLLLREVDYFWEVER